MALLRWARNPLASRETVMKTRLIALILGLSLWPAATTAATKGRIKCNAF